MGVLNKQKAKVSWTILNFYCNNLIIRYLCISNSKSDLSQRCISAQIWMLYTNKNRKKNWKMVLLRQVQKSHRHNQLAAKVTNQRPQTTTSAAQTWLRNNSIKLSKILEKVVNRGLHQQIILFDQVKLAPWNQIITIGNSCPITVDLWTQTN